MSIRRLVLVLGDPLDAPRDVAWKAEAYEESTHVWSTEPRIAMFLAAMRHFRDERRRR